MNVQIIKDPKGNPKSVVIPYQEWKNYELQYQKLRNKLDVLKGIEEAVGEVKEIKAGRKTLKELLSEY